MSDSWQRRRHPDDVPTPIAVSVADYCRRAEAPAAPSEVREALSTLDPSDDALVREVTDEEPTSAPLGPWAVIDVLRGASPELASTREQSGYYALAQELLTVREELLAARDAPGPSPHDGRFASAPASFASTERTAEPGDEATSARAGSAAVKSDEPASDESRAEGRPRRQSAAQKREALLASVAPRVRSGSSRFDDRAGDELPPLAPSRTRADRDSREEPRGRFATLTEQVRPFRELLEPSAAQMLESLIAQHGLRGPLTRALARQYEGGFRRQLGESDVERALSKHGLLERLHEGERSRIREALASSRGAFGRAASALGVGPAELSRLIDALGMAEAVEELREERRRGLLDAPLAQRLDSLPRVRYLDDLGIRDELTRSAREELLGHLEELGPLEGPDDLERLGSRFGAPGSLVERALRNLELPSPSPASRPGEPS